MQANVSVPLAPKAVPSLPGRLDSARSMRLRNSPTPARNRASSARSSTTHPSSLVHQSMSTLCLKQWLIWTSRQLTAVQLGRDHRTLVTENADLLSRLAVASNAFPALNKVSIGIEDEFRLRRHLT
jgi:hypothetical protein